MDAHALAQAYPGDQGDARDQFAAGADRAVLADHAAGADDAAVADHAAGTDADEGPHVSGGRHGGARVDHGQRMDAGLARGRDVEQRRDLGEGGVGILGDQRGAGGGLGVVGAQHHDPGTAVAELGAVARIGQEAELVGTGVGQGGDAMDGRAALAMEFQAEPGGDVSSGECRHQGTLDGRMDAQAGDGAGLRSS